jgi:hypothetical protein
MPEPHSDATETENFLGEPTELPVSEPRDEYNREAESLPPPDCVEIASMDSFPCSDPPGYYAIRL